MKKTLACVIALSLLISLLAACTTQQAVEPNIVIETQEVLVTQIVTKKEEIVVTQIVEVPPEVSEEPIKLVTPGKLTIGYVLAPGLVEKEGDEIGGVIGIIGTELAARMGLEAEWIPFDFPMIVPALQSGRIDLYVGGFSLTQPRAQIFYFSPAWLLQPETMAVRKGDKIASWEEGKEKDLTFATGLGFFQSGEWEKMGIKYHEFDTQDACFLDVVNSGSFGCSVGYLDQLYRREKNPESPIADLDTIILSGPRIIADLNALAVSKENPALAREVAQIMTDLWRDGEVEKAFHEVFSSSDITPLINPPEGHAFYIPGPWEEGTVPPASETYPDVTTIAPGVLTVGVIEGSPTIRLEGENLVGPEADILNFAASKLGLTLTGKIVTDEISAIKNGDVDVIAGSLPATKEGSYEYWQSTPVGFNPDYIYVAPVEGSGYPAYNSWEDITNAGGMISVIEGSSRIPDLQASGANLLEVSTAEEGLKALIDGSVQGFVGSTIDYLTGTSSDPAITNAAIGWKRNINLYSYGEAYIWGVKTGDGVLLDALNQAITAAWQQGMIQESYRNTYPGANISAFLAPGPTAIGTSYSGSKDYLFRSMWLPGPWLQRPTWVIK